MNDTLKTAPQSLSSTNPQSSVSTTRFELGDVIGRGGMATVYRAFDTQTQREVAVKILYDHLREHTLVVEHFRREVSIAQSLDHPNIVRTHSLLETPDSLGLVMELHGHGDLKDYLQRHGPMPYAQVVDIGVQVLSALQAAHERGIIHQDIKPHNILWDPQTRVAKLIDFGLAETEQIIALARPDSVMATVEYSAPEQFDDFATDARADLYSLAISLFELLSGNLPYRSETAAGVIQMHREAPPTDVRIFTRGIPAYIAETLLRAMAKIPEKRFANAHEMSLALQNKRNSDRTNAPHSELWESLKKNHAENPEPNNWNVFIPPGQFSDIVMHNFPVGRLCRDVLFNLVKSHAPYLNQNHMIPTAMALDTDVATNTAPDADTDTEPLREFAFDSILIKTSITKKPAPIVVKNQAYSFEMEPVAVACNLTFEQAEAMRHELGRNSVPAKIFQRNTVRRSSTALETKQADWNQLLEPKRKYNSLAHYFSSLPETITALIFGSATIFLAAVLSKFPFTSVIPALTLVFISALLLIVLFRFIAKSTTIKTLGFHKHWRLAKLNFNEFYLLDFDQTQIPQHKSELIDEEHVEIYHQLRSNRVRATYERIVLTLLNTDKTGEFKSQTQQLLAHATDIARRVTTIENRLTNQSQAMLFEQLTRLDTLLAKSDDTDQTAELIQQKTSLRTQLDQIDADRQELKTLGHELTTIATELRF